MKLSAWLDAIDTTDSQFFEKVVITPARYDLVAASPELQSKYAQHVLDAFPDSGLELKALVSWLREGFIQTVTELLVSVYTRDNHELLNEQLQSSYDWLLSAAMRQERSGPCLRFAIGRSIDALLAELAGFKDLFLDQVALTSKSTVESPFAAFLAEKPEYAEKWALLQQRLLAAMLGPDMEDPAKVREAKEQIATAFYGHKKNATGSHSGGIAQKGKDSSLAFDFFNEYKDALFVFDRWAIEDLVDLSQAFRHYRARSLSATVYELMASIDFEKQVKLLRQGDKVNKPAWAGSLAYYCRYLLSKNRGEIGIGSFADGMQQLHSLLINPLISQRDRLDALEHLFAVNCYLYSHFIQPRNICELRLLSYGLQARSHARQHVGSIRRTHSDKSPDTVTTVSFLSLSVNTDRVDRDCDDSYDPQKLIDDFMQDLGL